MTNEHDQHDTQLISLKQKLHRITQMAADGDIDRSTYRQMRDGIDNQIAVAKIAVNETEIERLDLEERLQQAKQYIHSMGDVWSDLTIEQQVKMQKVVLPDGMTYDKTNGRFGTAHLSYVLRLLSDFPIKESCLVAGSGLEPESGGSVIPVLSHAHGLSHVPVRKLRRRNSSL